MKAEKQQTAVEWLVAHFKKLQSEGEKMSWNQIIQITELLKEMEKEQIIKAYNTSFLLRDKPYSTAEKYYNETFKSE